MLRRVLVESPFAGRCPEPVSEREGWLRETEDASHNFAYVKALCRHLALLGQAPYASHLFLTQFLDDHDAREREIGIESGLTWGVCAQASVIGVDRGVSPGMIYGIQRARADGRLIEWLSLPEWRNSWLPAGVERATWREHWRSGDLVLGLPLP